MALFTVTLKKFFEFESRRRSGLLFVKGWPTVVELDAKQEKAILADKWFIIAPVSAGQPEALVEPKKGEKKT